jgi:predicted nucleotide-binding protein
MALINQAIKSLEERLAEYSDNSLRQSNQDVETSFERKIFLVHGREDGSPEAVARFLERLGFEAIILHEQPNLSRTVIEKIEAHSEVGFAVVPLTPDDEGKLKGNGPAASQAERPS